MRILKKIIIWLVIIIAILILVAYILPGQYKVQRSALIEGDRDMIFSMACDFNNWDLWSPWSSAMDSTAVFENIGKCEVGAVHKWKGEKMGEGEMKITEIIPGEKIIWELWIKGFSRKTTVGMFFEPEGDDWVVTWSAEGHLGYNPLYRYYGLMIDSDMGAEYERGLNNLKELCSKLPDYPGIEVTEVSSMPAVSVKDSIQATDIGIFLETWFPKLYLYAVRKGGTPAGHPYAIYYNWDPEGMILIEAGVPLQEAVEGEKEIMQVMSPGGKVVRASHTGPYEESGAAHEAINRYIMVLKMEFAGAPWEVYITDPSEEPDPQKWETIIYYPVR
jgi:effector-binding domain-containing protein